MKNIIFVLTCAVLISACATTQPNQRGTIPFFFAPDCTSFAEGRGVVADFIVTAPPQEIRETQPFSVALKFANHHKNPIVVDLRIQDTTDAEGFTDTETSATIDGAHYREELITTVDTTYTARQFQSPGCQLLDENNYIEKNLGKFTYRSIPQRPIDFDEQLHFTADISYNYESTIPTTLTICNPSINSITCNTQETLSGSAQLGPGTTYDPVTITRITKTLIGSPPTTAYDVGDVTLQLDITVQNLGGGLATELISHHSTQTFDFSVHTDDLYLTCETDTPGPYYGGSGRDINVALINNIARIFCTTDLSFDRPFSTTTVFALRHPYTYHAQTDPITLKNVRDEYR